MSEYVVEYKDEGVYATCAKERVVRCRDCVEHFSHNGGMVCSNFSNPEDGYYVVVQSDGFCSWGEPREGGLMGASYRPRSEDERDAFTCPKCGGQVVMEHDLPRRVTELGSIDFRCLGCGDWIDVVLDREHIYKPVREFEEYAVGVAREFFESRAREVRQ